jgi:hypothetical protein
MWHTCIMGYYLGINRNELLRYAITWMDLENILLIEIKDHILYNCEIQFNSFIYLDRNWEWSRGPCAC